MKKYLSILIVLMMAFIVNVNGVLAQDSVLTPTQKRTELKTQNEARKIEMQGERKNPK